MDNEATTEQHTLRYRSLRPRLHVSNNHQQTCAVCTKSASKETKFVDRTSRTCHQCTSFCTLCHCGTGGICVLNHTSVQWPAPPTAAETIAIVNQIVESVATAVAAHELIVHTICQECTIDPPCRRVRSCRCTKEQGSRNCTLHFKSTSAIELNASGSCNLCLEDIRTKRSTNSATSKVARSLRLESLSLPTTKAKATIVPKKNDSELRPVWIDLKKLLDKLQVLMNATQPQSFFKNNVHGRKLFYDRLGGMFGLDGNHYGWSAGVIMEKMIKWFTSGKLFTAGVVLRKLPTMK